MRWALKVAYRGEGFYGSARQPGLRTVEGELLRVLRTTRALDDPREARFGMASRTDRGVNARGNVVAFDSWVDARAIVAAVARSVEDVWIPGYVRVVEDFNPRHARERWYRYVLRTGLDVARLRTGARLFEGEHDFRRFAKGPARGVCDLRTIEVWEGDGVAVLDFRGDRFLWNMVRRIVQALVQYAEGALTSEDLRQALRGKELPLPPASPGDLWLMDVRYGDPSVDFVPNPVGCGRGFQSLLGPSSTQGVPP